MRYTIRDSQTDYSVHNIPLNKLISILKQKRVLTEDRVDTAASKILALSVGKSLKVKWLIVMRTE